MIRRALGHRFAARAGLTVVGGALLVATFLPWFGKDGAQRNSYDLLGTVERLGLTPDGAIATLVRFWPVLPLLVVTSVVLAWWELHYPSVIAGVLGALYAGSVSGVLVWLGLGSTLPVRLGAWLCAVSSVLLVVVSTWMAVRRATGRDARAPRAAPLDDPS